MPYLHCTATPSSWLCFYVHLPENLCSIFGFLLWWSSGAIPTTGNVPCSTVCVVGNNIRKMRYTATRFTNEATRRPGNGRNLLEQNSYGEEEEEEQQQQQQQR